MKLILNRDYFNNPTPPRVFLCTTGKKRIQELQATSRQLNGKWATYSELSFEVQQTYVDMLTGETKIHPAYDKIEAPRMVFLENYGYWGIQDIDDTSSDNDVKAVSCFSSEYATSNKYLTNFHINTGEVDSAEVLYNESQFGLDYSGDRDSFYKFAVGDFDPYESYYKRNYTDSDSYTYEQVQIADAEEYATLLEKSNETYGQLSDKLYVKNFPNVQFYNQNRPGLSLLDLVFAYIPEWKIGNVDASLWHKERRFSEDRISVYDFLMNNVSETFGCVFVWDSLTGLVHVYENADDDDESINEASTRWETDVYVSKNNLASECKVNYSADNIKTKLVVTGSDGLDIREVNLGGNSIMDLSFYHTEDWMERDLYDRYSEYLEELQEAETGLDRYGLPSKKYSMSYPDAMQGWVSANNRHHELMHAIPSEENVLLVGDEFKKLFCIYTPIDTAYTEETILNDITNSTKYISGTLYYDKQLTVPITNIENEQTFVVGGFKLQYIESENRFQVMENLVNTSVNALVSKLNQYHVDEDTQGNKNDNILLKVRNASSDVATIRIFDDHNLIASEYNSYYNYYSKDDRGNFAKIDIADATEFNTQKAAFGGELYTNNYQIQSVIVRASTGVSEAPDTFSMREWVSGELTAEKIGLAEYSTEDTEKEYPTYYTVTYIGTMGAYFVLAKDEVIVTDNGILEVSENYLQSCGVNLLKEKHKIYTSIFQTQTEAMFSQEKYQCIVQDEQPKGDYKDGTRWLDSNDGKGSLYEYNSNTGSWVKLVGVGATVSQSDKYNYENYQRYLDNYNKLQAVQKHLVVKEREAEYCLNGYAIDYTINLSGGQSLVEAMQRIVRIHLDELKTTNGVVNNYSFVGQLTNSVWPLYTFTTSFDPIVYDKNTKPYSNIEQYYVKNYYFRANVDNQAAFDNYNGTLYAVASQNPTTYTVANGYNNNTQYYYKSTNLFVYTPVDIDNKETFDKYGKTADTTLYVQTSGHTFVVYLQGGKPYVAYANSQGVYNMVMEYIRKQTDMSTFFSKDQWIRLSPFIKEDEFTDSNFLLTGYESEEERIAICKELMEAAAKELKTLCKPSLEFSMTMANILAIPEFAPLVDQFQLGNFIRVEIREGYVKRARLLEVNLNFDDLSSFDCTFGNLITAKSEIDKHAELLSQAVSAGKQVAKSGNSWQRSVEKTNQIEDDINAGLQDAALKIRTASGQNIEISDNGLIGRKLIDGTTDRYEDEQVALINNKLVFTADNWNTSKSCFGKFTVDGQDRFGVLSDAVVSGYIQGSIIEGGSMEIGGTGGIFRVNSDGSVQILGPDGGEKYTNDRFQVRLVHSGPTVFSDFGDECIITCSVYDSGVDITQRVIENGGTFTWNRSTSGWTPTYVNGKPNVIKVKHTDIDGNSPIDCIVDFDETKFNT